MLYLVVPFSLILLPNLSAVASLTFALPVDRNPVLVFFGAPEVAAYYLSIPLFFAVLNPSGIVRGLAAASLGFAFASVGFSGTTGDVRYIFGQSALWEGLPVGPVFSGLLQIPIGAALAYAGYRDKWHIPVRVTAIRRASLILAGSALIVWAVAETLLYENMGFAVAVALAFLCIGLLMQRYRWPRLPLLLGFICGPLVEKFLHIAISTYGLPGLVQRPIPLGLAVMVLALAVLSYRLHKSGTPSGEVGTAALRQPVLTALLQRRNIVPALGLAAGVAFWWGSLGFEDLFSWFLPRVAGLAVAALCLLELAIRVRNPEPQWNAWPAHDVRGTEPPV